MHLGTASPPPMAMFICAAHRCSLSPKAVLHCDGCMDTPYCNISCQRLPFSFTALYYSMPDMGDHPLQSITSMPPALQVLVFTDVSHQRVRQDIKPGGSGCHSSKSNGGDCWWGGSWGMQLDSPDVQKGFPSL